MLEAIYPGGVPIALSLTAYNAFLTGLIVFLKRRDKAGKLYFLSSFFIALWGVGVSFMLNNGLSPQVSQKWGYFSNASAFFIPATWLHFVLYYTGYESQLKYLRNFFYVVTFALAPLTYTKYFIAGFQNAVGFTTYPIPGIIYYIFAIMFFISVTTAFILFYRAYKNAAICEHKTDYQYLGLASFYGFFMGGLSFLPVFGVDLPQYNLLLMPIWQIALAYIMTRHQIFDLDKVIQAAHKDKLAAIGTLATSINHEIRNPLYIVKGLAESHLANMKDGIYPDKDKALAKANEVLSKSVDQAARAMDIMKRFAMFAKQGVSQTAQPETVQLEDIMSDILPLVSHELELDKIKLIQTIPAGITLNVDRRHIEEILFNLIVNACQAMKSHGVEGEIRISAEAMSNKVAIAIEDNGPGISADDLAKIFEPFYTTKQEGTGLGLYITKQLVERNGGKISVKSKLGQGTQFRMEFKA